MARRRKGPDVFGIAEALVLLIVAGMAFPPIRAFLIDAAVEIGVVAILAAVVGILFRRKRGDIDLETSAAGEAPTGKGDGGCPTQTFGVDEAEISLGKKLNALPRAARCGQRALPADHAPGVAEQVREIDWFQFEKLVALAFSGTGVVTRRGGANPDGGIDLVLERQGEQVGIQCKQWKSWKVGVKVVRELIGALADAGLNSGIVVGLSFTAEARELAARHRIELVDESGLVNLLKNLDAAEVDRILLDRRKVCPKCEREMTLRTARRGAKEGSQFWGCTAYPRCNGKLPFEDVN